MKKSMCIITIIIAVIFGATGCSIPKQNITSSMNSAGLYSGNNSNSNETNNGNIINGTSSNSSINSLDNITNSSIMSNINMSGSAISTNQSIISAIVKEGGPVNNSNNYYISPSGSDKSTGTIEYPLKTIQKARDIIRTRNKNMTANINVYLRGGEYSISSPIVFDESDSGTNGYFIKYMAYQNEVPTISGGQQITGWTKYKDNIYKVPLNRTAKLRQMYVNDQRAVMSQGDKFIFNADVRGYGNYTVNANEPYAIDGGSKFAGYTFNKANLGQYANPSDVELCSQAGFGYHVVGLSDIISSGTKKVAILQQPIGAIAQSIPQYGCAFVSNLPEIKAVSMFHFQNAFELLDSEGEFYYNRAQKTLYYYKRANENMSTAKTIVPTSEGLIVLKGSNTKSRISNIEFTGITFAYDHWSMMKVGNSYGDTTVQSISMYVKYIDNGDFHGAKYTNLQNMRAAIEVANSSNINFQNNTFKHLGSVGISLGNDSSNSKLIGNVFSDIGSSALSVGDARNVYIGDGDFPDYVEGVADSNSIQNNYIIDVGVETLQAPAVAITYTSNLDFSHNEIINAPYTGVSLGWGWVNYMTSKTSHDNKVNFNVIKNVMQKMHDGAGIYTLSEQPNSEIKGNYIGEVGGASTGAAIYLDQGSGYFNVNNNYSENPNGWFFVWGKGAKVHDISAADNYSSTIYGNETDNLNNSPNFKNAHPNITAADIKNKNNAGLQSKYAANRFKR